MYLRLTKEIKNSPSVEIQGIHLWINLLAPNCVELQMTGLNKIKYVKCMIYNLINSP